MAESNDSWIVHSPPIIQTAPVISTGDSSFTDLPYFLHHSDNLGTMLVSHPHTGDNYATWSHAMHIVLCPKTKSTLLMAPFLALLRLNLLLPHGNDASP